MMSNERTTFHSGGYIRPPKDNVPEEILRSAQIQVERKIINCSLRENARGRFLRISEEVAGHHNCVMVPATRLEKLRQAIDRMIKASGEASRAA